MIEDVFYCIESWKNIQKTKRIHNPFLLLQQKKTRRGKEYASFGCTKTFHDSEGTATGIHFNVNNVKFEVKNFRFTIALRLILAYFWYRVCIRKNTVSKTELNLLTTNVPII